MSRHDGCWDTGRDRIFLQSRGVRCEVSECEVEVEMDFEAAPDPDLDGRRRWPRLCHFVTNWSPLSGLLKGSLKGSGISRPRTEREKKKHIPASSGIFCVIWLFLNTSLVCVCLELESSSEHQNPIFAPRLTHLASRPWMKPELQSKAQHVSPKTPPLSARKQGARTLSTRPGHPMSPGTASPS